MLMEDNVHADKKTVLFAAALMVAAMNIVTAASENTAGPSPDRPETKAQPAPAVMPNMPDVRWETPSENESGSMPLGNGDMALNVWVEKDGALYIYLSKSDALDEVARPVKLAKIRVTATPNPLPPNARFLQILRLRQGCIEVKMGEGNQALQLRIWADANAPVVHVEGTSPLPREVQVVLETLRHQGRATVGAMTENFEAGKAFTERADEIAVGQGDRIVWYHRNRESIYPVTLQLQGLQSLAGDQSDPLLNRTSGGCIEGEGLMNVDAQTLRSEKALSSFHIRVVALSSQTETVDAWLAQMREVAAHAAAAKLTSARAAHELWWQQFWERSWIQVRSSPAHDDVSRGYALQRFMLACAGRGQLPIKFNGGPFTVAGNGVPAHPSVVMPQTRLSRYSADDRRWGQCYWFQNTRLVYWPMLASGDFDLLQPFFSMYTRALPLAEKRTQIYFGHKGAFFPETMHFWGTYRNGDYGWNRDGHAAGFVENRFVRYYWQGGFELCMMMLDYHALTQDDAFARQTMLPLCRAILQFYDEHWKRDQRGKLHMAPAQALETVWDAVNPATDVAGLQAVLERLIGLPGELVEATERQQWQRLRSEVPDLPLRDVGGQEALAPVEALLPESMEKNKENAELYAVFPYNLISAARPNGLDLARYTFLNRTVRGRGCWYQDSIHAACLGFTAEAAAEVTAYFSEKNPESRFPGFWAPHFDWYPDLDHGGVAMTALQRMLMQVYGRRIVLLPAWPAGWDVDFKLHAPEQTTVRAIVRAGKVVTLDVTPESRRSDVEISGFFHSK